VGAYFLADISHIGGLVAAGVVPSPIGIAHVVMSTTHKSLDGPRGAVLLTTDAAIAKKIDKAVFPGEQGGPHVNVFAALALTFKLAKPNSSKNCRPRPIKNARPWPTSSRSADCASRSAAPTPTWSTSMSPRQIEDGTASAATRRRASWISSASSSTATPSPATRIRLDPSGIRLGTPWITQRGFNEKKTRELTDIMADVLLACAPHAWIPSARDAPPRQTRFQCVERCQAARAQAGREGGH
jgi:glycine hydroxymethyltransferase